MTGDDQQENGPPGAGPSMRDHAPVARSRDDDPIRCVGHLGFPHTLVLSMSVFRFVAAPIGICLLLMALGGVLEVEPHLSPALALSHKMLLETLLPPPGDCTLTTPLVPVLDVGVSKLFRCFDE